MIWILLITFRAALIPGGSYSTFEDCDAARREIIQAHPDIPAILSCVQREGT